MAPCTSDSHDLFILRIFDSTFIHSQIVKGNIRMKSFVSCREIVRYVFVTPAVHCLLLGIVSMVFVQNTSPLVPILVILLFYCLGVIMELVFLHHALCLITVDRDGISNKYFRIKWGDMEKHGFNIVEVKIGVAPVKLRVHVACFGKADVSSFPSIDPRHTIFLSINEKNIHLIRLMAGEKSPL